MIVGQGIDIVKVKRIEKILGKFESKFTTRIFARKEIKFQNTIKKINDFNFAVKFASRFAAKEATVKALGTGFRNGIRFTDIEVFNEINGKPFINLLGKAKSVIENLQTKNKKLKVDLSMSNEKEYAIAIVTISLID